MAEREPGQTLFECVKDVWDGCIPLLDKWLEYSAYGKKRWSAVEAAIRADERERCACIAEEEVPIDKGFHPIVVETALAIAAAIRADERERCAKLAEQFEDDLAPLPQRLTAHDIAAAIRADERKRCAEVAQDLYDAWNFGPDPEPGEHWPDPPTAKDAAQAIRQEPT